MNQRCAIMDSFLVNIVQKLLIAVKDLAKLCKLKCQVFYGRCVLITAVTC